MRFAARLSFLSLFLFCVQNLVGASLYSLDCADRIFNDDPLTIGFEFTANDTFKVTSLGWFDGGFQNEHTVGLFDSEGNLLVSTILPAGSVNPADQLFRYASIDPLLLVAGQSYTLAGTTAGWNDAYTTNEHVSGFAVDPAFTIGANAARYDYVSEFAYPTSHYSDYRAYIGPNLQGDVVTPEPQAAALLGLGMCGLLAARWKLRSRSSR
jgi:Domain of unknown function (DUF4082)